MNPDGQPPKRLSLGPLCPGAFPEEDKRDDHGREEHKDGKRSKDEGSDKKVVDGDNSNLDKETDGSPLALPGKKRAMVHGLKASLSRASLIRTFSGSTPSVPTSPAATIPSLPLSQPPSPRDVRHVYEPQPSAYWTGRFTSLSDLDLHSMTAPLTLSPSPPPIEPSPAPAQRGRLQKRPPAQTTQSGRDKERFSAALDQDERARRVFAELEGCCRTIEARRSLFEWREEWARRCGRPGVVPGRGGILGRLKWG